MKTSLIVLIVTIAAVSFFAITSFQSVEHVPILGIDRISMKMVNKSVNQGKVIKIEADIFYQSNGKMVTHFIYPKDFVILNNNKGEMFVYEPDFNTVTKQQSLLFSTETSHIYYFLSNKTSDLGLKELGYTLMSTNFEDNYMITIWSPPPAFQSGLSSIELVHEKYYPIYLGYQDEEGNTIKKVYYDDYKLFYGLSFPLKITEISYTPDNDSVVVRINYSDLKVNNDASSEYFDFKIPENAEVVK